MLPNPDPSLAHRFSVDIDGVTAAVFTECTLPSFDIDTKEIIEGGRAGYSMILPGPFKPGKVSLKRGLVIADKMLDWYFKILNWEFSSNSDLYKTVAITLYKGYTPAFTFEFRNAFPVKWQGPSLKADTTAVAVEQIDLVYESVSIEKGTANLLLDVIAAGKGIAGNLATAALAVRRQVQN